MREWTNSENAFRISDLHAEVAVAPYAIAGAARQDGPSLWKSCFAETVDIGLS